MLPVIRLHYLLHVFWGFFCVKKYPSVTPAFDIPFCSLCAAVVRHRELSGVVNQPSPCGGAAGDGRGELCRRHQLCLRESQLLNCWCCNYSQISTCVREMLQHFSICVQCTVCGRGSPYLLTCCAVFSNLNKQYCHCFAQTLYNTNISLSIFYV